MPEIREYIEAYRSRAKEEKAAVERRAIRAHEIALRCAKKLAEDFGATRIFLLAQWSNDFFASRRILI
jgi:hypothetical protein